MLRSALSSFNKLDPRAQKTLGIARIFEAIESLRMDANNIQIINLAKFCENTKWSHVVRAYMTSARILVGEMMNQSGSWQNCKQSPWLLDHCQGAAGDEPRSNQAIPHADRMPFSEP